MTEQKLTAEQIFDKKKAAQISALPKQATLEECNAQSLAKPKAVEPKTEKKIKK